MSSSAVAWAFRQPVVGNEKLLLLTLADCADDYNRARPHVRRLEAETGLGRRTILRLLGNLEDAGVIGVERAAGLSCVYVLSGAPERIPPATRQARPGAVASHVDPTSHERATSVANGTGAKTAPVPNEHPQERTPCQIGAGGGADLAPVTADQCQYGTGPSADLAPVWRDSESLCSTSSEDSYVTQGITSVDREGGVPTAADLLPRTDAPGGAAPRVVSKSNLAIGTRLPNPWALPRSWGVWAVGLGLSESVVRQIAEDFADHWHAAPGQRGRKSDWQATWRRWIRREVDDRLRKAGLPPRGRESGSVAVRSREDPQASLAVDTSTDAWLIQMREMTGDPSWEPPAGVAPGERMALAP